jgi:tetratricopeptide (TPR) repeat protein
VGRYEEAITGLRELLDAGGDLPFIRLSLWDALFIVGEYGEAYQQARRYYELTGKVELLEALERTFEADGYQGAMPAVAKALEEASANTYVAGVDIARIHAHAGQRDRALEWLEKAAEVPETSLVYVMAQPIYESLHGDPRFEAIRARMGLSGAG